MRHFFKKKSFDDVPNDVLEQNTSDVNVQMLPKKNMVFFVALLACVLFGALLLMQKAPAKLLVVDETGLNAHEAHALHLISQNIGAQQFFYANLEQIGHQVQNLSWVDEFSIRRTWGKGIVLSVLPKKAVANFGTTNLIDAKGQIFTPADLSALNNATLAYLYSTPNDATQAMQKMQNINTYFSPLGMVVKKLDVLPRQTLLVQFKDGLYVVVDYENQDEKLYKLAQILQQKNEVSAQKSTLARIDLRYKNGFALTYKPTYAPNTLK